MRSALVVMGFAIALFVVGTSPACGEQSTSSANPLPSDPYIALRSGLPNARIRFLHDKKGRVAFLGGSITHMSNGWRSLACEALEKRFAETRFDFIDAGIPSTDSTLGPFRLQRDVLGRGRVDLLFVEFAVNDECNGRKATESVRGMEGIIRKARQDNPCMDIVMLYFVDPPKMDVIRKGQIPSVIASHQKVAGHYGIPSIDLAREVTERIRAGEFDWKRFGGLHPARFGHGVYARSIGRLMDLTWKEALPEDAKVRPHRLPDRPLDPLNYGRGRLVDLKQPRVLKGWQHVPSWTTKQGHTRPGFCNVPMLVAESPGASLKMTFTGTAIGILVVAGSDVGVIEFVIDDAPPKRLDQYTQWSHYLHIPWAYMLDADLKDGKHELTLSTTADKHAKSLGHAARIVKFLVN